jgi:hypothetical protein
MNKGEHLLLLIIAGVIIADFVAHAAGTKAFFGGLNTLWTIGVRPTDVSAIKSTSVTNGTGSAGSKKV